MTFNIAFVLYPGFEELDFAGPYEAFGAVRKRLSEDWRLFTVATQKTVCGTHGLSVNVDYLLDEAPAAQMLVVPGGQTIAALRDEALVEFVQRTGTTAEWVTSVCTGTFMLQRADLLDGKRATTYWAALDRLRQLDGIEVVEGGRWVQDGNVVTAAGVSAGIDMALYVIGQILSPRDARTIQRYMEYYPAPPYADSPV